MRNYLTAVLVAAAVLLAGCATTPQEPIKFTAARLKESPQRQVGVIMTALPKVDTFFPGAGCLLCYAAASATNSTLTKYTHTLSEEDLPQIKTALADTLRQSGATVRVIDEPLDLKALPSAPTKGPNIASKDFRGLKAKYGVDELVVVDVTEVGIARQYSAYIPSSDPKAVFVATGYIVDLGDNSYQWYQPESIEKASDGAWDEPPSFPGLTNAYFQALELGKDGLVASLRGN